MTKPVKTINVPANIRDLQFAKTMIENAYNDLKNLKEFREAGMPDTREDRFITLDSYRTTLMSLDDLIEAAMVTKIAKAGSK